MRNDDIIKLLSEGKDTLSFIYHREEKIENELWTNPENEGNRLLIQIERYEDRSIQDINISLWGRHDPDHATVYADDISLIMQRHILEFANIDENLIERFI